MAKNTAKLRATRAHYSRAPILQAVIDFGVISNAPPSLEMFDSLKWDADSDFASRAPIYHANINFNVDTQSPTTTNVQQGYQFISKDQKRVAAFRLGGFSFNRMPPYDSWEPFGAEARRLFEKYCEVRKPDSVTRVAVRYINRLELPLPINDFREFLQTVPEVSAALPQGLSGFVLQLKIPQLDLPGGMLILNEGLLDSTAQTAAVLLDIDLFVETKLEPKNGELWEVLEELHSRKNAIFEASITERTRELIR